MIMKVVTDEQAVSIFLEEKNVSRAALRLGIGQDRLVRILDSSGVARRRIIPKHPQKKKTIEDAPKEYRDAIEEGYLGKLSIDEIERKFNVTSTMLYKWIERLEIPKRFKSRKPKTKPVPIRWWCWECGERTPDRQHFCCEEHRRAFRNAMGPNTELGAIYCLQCDAPLEFPRKTYCSEACRRVHQRLDRKKPRSNEGPSRMGGLHA